MALNRFIGLHFYPKSMIAKHNHLLTLLDWSPERILRVIAEAITLKNHFKANGPSQVFKGKSLALFFEKPSLRTIATFQVGMTQLGGASLLLDPNSIGLGKRETVADVATCLSRWIDGLVVRCYDQKLVDELAKYSSFPVINALTDSYHPCQALAFGQTLTEHLGGLKGKRVAFIGDGNNVANSILILAAKTGMHFTLACPEGFEQPADLLNKLTPVFEETGGSYRCLHQPEAAVESADVLYTDVWVSMGQEDEKETRKERFLPYQINSRLLDFSKKACLVSHCLPAHRGEEITDDVMESKVNLCFDEAENRLHIQKAILLELIETH
jgi:ornithine carbamoyltransferase